MSIIPALSVTPALTRTFATGAKTLFKEKGPETLEFLSKAGKVVTNYITPKAREKTTRSFKAAQVQNSRSFRQLGNTTAEQSARTQEW